MDIQAYISSGIIESYLLGLASAEEAQELQTLCLQYPEIREAMDAYAGTLEKYATLHAAEPPAGLKSKIWNRLQPSGTPSVTAAVKDMDKLPAPVIHPVMKYMVAASILLLIGSLLLNLVFFNKYQDYKDKYNRLNLAQSTLANQNQVYQTRMEQYRHDMHVVTDTAMKAIVMEGVPLHPGMKATVYWNKYSGDLYLKINNLPAPPSGKQYQLWAIIDGKPVSAGMYDINDIAALQKMKTIAAGAQAFAITLEKEGGSPAPTLSDMYVMGKI